MPFADLPILILQNEKKRSRGTNTAFLNIVTVPRAAVAVEHAIQAPTVSGSSSTRCW
ncbi:unnamed protein product [Ectocarpus sp. CCAP 1310/34]|nr:unnamed protein product [Ectocarpus sp. CCAP 1310/34]